MEKTYPDLSCSPNGLANRLRLPRAIDLDAVLLLDQGREFGIVPAVVEHVGQHGPDRVECRIVFELKLACDRRDRKAVLPQKSFDL